MKHLVFTLAIVSLTACSTPVSPVQDDNESTKLKLEQLTIVSRHNVRAPLQKNIDSTKRNVDSLQKEDILMRFSVPGSNLTQRGIALETIMGSYFRKWLREEGFLKDYKVEIKKKNGKEYPDTSDIVPDVSMFYFAASPRERTVASARAFAVGFVPSADITVHHSELGSPDINFLPFLVDHGKNCKGTDFQVNEGAFLDKAQKEVDCIIDSNKTALESAYNLLEDAVYYSKSLNSKRRKHLTTDGLKNEVNLNFHKKDGKIKEPEATDTSHLKAANQLSDALILQFYEMQNPSSTGLNIPKDSLKAWRTLADIKDIYSKILFTSPMVAVNTSHWLLWQVKKGIQNNDFTFICTHDTSISALLAALQADYSLPDSLTIEGLTPNGCKLCIEKYRRGDKHYGRVRMLYQSNEQLRNMTVLDYKNTHPQSFNITFKGLKCINFGNGCNCSNSDKGCIKCEKCKEGCYYEWEDLIKRINDTIDAFAKVAKGEKPF